MSEHSTTAAPAPSARAADSQAAGTQLGDGTVLYPSRQQAAAAKRQTSVGPFGPAVKDLSHVSYGESYLSKDGRSVPCTLDGLLEFQAAGFIVVMVSLAALWLLSSALYRLIRPFELSAAAGNEPAAAGSATSLAPSPPAAGGLHPGLSDQQLVVLLTAAAAEMLDGPFRIETIRQLNPAESNWAAEGRSVLHSHRLK